MSRVELRIEVGVVVKGSDVVVGLGSWGVTDMSDQGIFMVVAEPLMDGSVVVTSTGLKFEGDKLETKLSPGEGVPVDRIIGDSVVTRSGATDEFDAVISEVEENSAVGTDLAG